MAQDIFTHRNDLHRECWDLLPWIANERATPHELSRIEAHLQDCSECREELENQRSLRAAMRAETPVVLAPQTSLQKLLQRIDGSEDTGAKDGRVAEIESTNAPAAPMGSKQAARPPQWLAIAAAIQGIVIATLLVTLWQQSREQLTAGLYVTMTSTPSTAPGPVIRVVFADGVALSEANEILLDLNAQIVAGPNTAGVYTLALNATDTPVQTVERIAARLREDRRIVYAEAAEAAVAQPRTP
jgi:hypothetical protein